MNIKIIFAATAALALTAGAPAHAAKNESARALAAADAGAGAKAEERKTCRLFDNSVSRMKRERLCMTREQWKKFDEEQRAM